MPLAQYDLYCDAGADWQRVVRLRDPATGFLVGMDAAAMEIRNANGVLVLRLDANSSRCLIADDGASIMLHITAEDSFTYFHSGNFPGAVQAVGYWGIGRSYLYDLFCLYDTGVQDRLLRGFFHVDPNITQPAGSTPNLALTIGQRGSYP
jgi:hypothetical protein